MNVQEGSPVWLAVFVVVSALIILRQVLRGWRQGPVRQVLGFVILLSTYAVVWFGGKLISPLVQPLFDLPNFLVTVLAGLVLGLVWYFAMRCVMSVIFRKTEDQDSSMIRVAYGTSGAVLGAVFGLFSVWILVMGIRLLGSVAESRQHAILEAVQTIAAQQPTQPGAPTPTPPPAGRLVNTLIKLKDSIELGPVEQVVETVDIIPAKVYQMLDRVAMVAVNPDRADRFLRYPGASTLTKHPKIKALSEDAEISELAAAGKYLSLLTNKRVVEAANDPELAALLKNFELEKALDYAIKPPASNQ